MLCALESWNSYYFPTHSGVHGEVKLQYETWGSGPQAVLFMHGGVGGAASVAVSVFMLQSSSVFFLCRAMDVTFRLRIRVHR